MRISTLPATVSTGNGPKPYREADEPSVADRDGRQRRDQSLVVPDRQTVERISTRAVESISRAENSALSSQRNTSFAPRIQQALQAFENAGPSPEEQLGIELAGIDTYA